MQPPLVKYNKELYFHISEMENDRKMYMMCDLDVLGEGAAGVTYTAYVKPVEKFPEQIVLKEQKRTRFCANEITALHYLKDLMIKGELPGYYIFTYGSFTSGSKKYIILEKVDQCIDDYLTCNNLTTKQYFRIFYHIANAVSYLEDLKFNHGDLWIENIMIKWHDNGEFTIKLIDYDSAFQENSDINNPSLGGSDYYRDKFILGYDLNRFFDSLIFSYESFIEKKKSFKLKKIEKALKKQKRGKKVVVPNENDYDSVDEEFDAENIIYPQEIIDFMYELKPNEPNNFDDCPEMSGKSVMKLILSKCEKLGIKF